MAITTASELQTALLNWSNRPDLSARLGEFVSLAEARFNRDLRVRAMEASLPVTTLVDGAASLPAGFLAFKELRCDGDPSYTLEPKPLEWVRSRPQYAAAAQYFAVTNDEVVCWPQTGDVLGTYYTSIPSLNDNGTNWLLTTHPDVYLFACLEEIGLYLRDAGLYEVAGKRAAALMEQLKGADAANAMNGGPLTARAR